MKTSNKLLLSFVGLIVLLMFLSNTIMWANYKRGRSGDGLLTADENFTQKATITPIAVFKVLKVEGPRNYPLQVSKAEKFQLSSWSEKKQEYLYSIQNDTMFLKLREEDQFTLECPTLQEVILAEKSSVVIRNFELPALKIVAGKYCGIELFETKITKLDINGGEENMFAVQGNSAIDSIYLKLGKSGEIRSFDIPYNYVSMEVDSLRELTLQGRSLTSMKQIK